MASAAAGVEDDLLSRFSLDRAGGRGWFGCGCGERGGEGRIGRYFHGRQHLLLRGLHQLSGRLGLQNGLAGRKIWFRIGHAVPGAALFRLQAGHKPQHNVLARQRIAIQPLARRLEGVAWAGGNSPLALSFLGRDAKQAGLVQAQGIIALHAPAVADLAINGGQLKAIGRDGPDEGVGFKLPSHFHPLGIVPLPHLIIVGAVQV